jgi:hypothetical protein
MHRGPKKEIEKENIEEARSASSSGLGSSAVCVV